MGNGKKGVAVKVASYSTKLFRDYEKGRVGYMRYIGDSGLARGDGIAGLTWQRDME